jgi:Tol biopolymer transport system component
MKFKSTILIHIVLAFSACSSTTKSNGTGDSGPTVANGVTAPIPSYITNTRQLTFAGPRAGEGYFSRDGRYLVFQSERERGNPFYQIYLMDMQTGATRRLSTGTGKTTCAWIHPSNRWVLFSSTHEDPDFSKKVKAEYEERRNPKNRYNWSFDETYDIYRADLNGKGLVKLTNAKGYDAEGSYSPDGRWIAFASNRAAYARKMTPDEAAAFQKDPSTMMDIYIMKADGSQVRQLTTTPGYDGGPFFSPDGQRLTFRRFNTDGRTADIYTIGVDGKDEKRLTDFKALSWAPYYHPSGDYLIFASNKFGHANFELFIVDTEGKMDPVRVTESDGFDGLPVFSPDGRQLIWSRANEKGEAQLHRADWNDDLARTALNLRPSGARSWVNYLTATRFEGRMSGGKAESEYATTLAQAFQDMGLAPVNGHYLQKVDFISGIELGIANNLEISLKDETLRPRIGIDWIPLSYSKTGSFESAPVLFAGYGIVAPAVSGQPAYDSFVDIDVKGKWVIVFSGLPENVSQERRFQLHPYARLQHKAMVARQRGALGLIVIEDGGSAASSMAVKFEGRGEDAGIPVLRLSNPLADRLFASAGTTRRAWTEKLTRGDSGVETLPNINFRTDIDLKFVKSTGHNVLAMLPAVNAKATVVVGAHLDHLGHGESGNSLSNHPGIHPGADDNASGVAAVMEIARALSSAAKDGRLNLRQNVLFGLWTAEEIGILGSSYFVNTNKLNLSAYLNLDMVGRYRRELLIQGVASADEWGQFIEKANAASDLVIKTQTDPYVPSDGLSFYMKGIPSIMFFTGSHPEYHTIEDKADLINYDGLTRIADFVRRLTANLAQSAPTALTYRKVESQPKASRSGTRGFRLYLGTIPDYAREGVQGVAITGTSKDSPAEKAGLQAGDVIIELGGMTIKNLNDYVYCLQALKANEKTSLRVRRADREQELEIIPVLKSQQ